MILLLKNKKFINHILHHLITFVFQKILEISREKLNKSISLNKYIINLFDYIKSLSMISFIIFDYHHYFIYNLFLALKFYNYFLLINGDWGLGIGDWGLGIGPNTPTPKPKTPNPQTQKI